MHLRSMARAMTVLLLAGLLAGRASSGDEPPADLLGHVVAGQGWRFRVVDGEGRLREEVLRVRGVAPASVHFARTTASIDGRPVEEEALAGEWRRDGGWQPPASAPGRVVGRRVEATTLRVGDTTFSCDLHVEGAGEAARRTWVVVKAGREVFPGVIRQTIGGRTTLELVAVERP